MNIGIKIIFLILYFFDDFYCDLLLLLICSMFFKIIG